VPRRTKIERKTKGEIGREEEGRKNRGDEEKEEENCVWPLGRVFLIYVFTRLNELWLQCSRHSTNPPHGAFLHMNELNFPTRRKNIK